MHRIKPPAPGACHSAFCGRFYLLFHALVLCLPRRTRAADDPCACGVFHRACDPKKKHKHRHPRRGGRGLFVLPETQRGAACAAPLRPFDQSVFEPGSICEIIRNRRPLPLPTVLLFEALIVLAEGCLLRLLFGKERRFFALSLAGSAASYGLGLLLSALLL